MRRAVCGAALRQYNWEGRLQSSVSTIRNHDAPAAATNAAALGAGPGGLCAECGRAVRTSIYPDVRATAKLSQLTGRSCVSRAIAADSAAAPRGPPPRRLGNTRVGARAHRVLVLQDPSEGVRARAGTLVCRPSPQSATTARAASPPPISSGTI